MADRRAMLEVALARWRNGRRPRLTSVVVCAAFLGNLGCGLVPREADWTTDATAYRDRSSQNFDFDCPHSGTAATVWGTDVYTDDSSICTAGVHAGVITFASGGIVRIQITDGLDAYTGSDRNGVISLAHAQTEHAFRVIVR